MNSKRLEYMELLERMILVLSKKEIEILMHAAYEDPEFIHQMVYFLDNELHRRTDKDEMQVVGRRIKAEL